MHGSGSVSPGSRKAALVTGGGVRIGRAIALALAEAGMNVLVHYRHSEAAAVEVCRLIEARGHRAWPLGANLDDPQAPARLMERAIATAGSLEVLVHSAAGFPRDELRSLSFDRLVATLRGNAWAPFELSRIFAEKIGRGQIVNLLDSRITGTDPEHVSYLLSKQLLASLTRLLALELAPGITVNAVAPGLILPPPGATQVYLEERASTVPLKRHGTAEQIARAVVFLVQSEFITGQVLFVDGGRHLAEYPLKGPQHG